MTGLVRKATLLSVCGLLAASAAFAAVPDPTQSTCPAHINLVGSNGATGDPAGNFSVTVRDLSGALIPGSIVVIDFQACTDMLFCTDQFGNSTADCPTMTVRKATDGSGVASFSIVGGANIAAGGPTGSPAGSVKIFADGVLLCAIDSGAFNLDDDINGVAGSDLSLWLGEFGGGNNPPRSDYDGDASVAGSDLSLWLGEVGAGGSGVGCATTECGP
jgi:hypothetical protein